jgi:hypothetical protein
VASSSRSITITFGGAGTAGPQDVLLTIRDYCSDAIIAGADVTLSSAAYPAQTLVSAANGQVTFLAVPPGDHDLLATKDGYLSTAVDTLANDIIRV